jgi:hypothetical protein
LPLADEEAGDQEAGEDEEHVHADEPSRDARQPGVIEDDGQHRKAAQTFDVRAERAAVTVR